MSKIITAAVAAAFLILAAGSASAAFSLSSLRGTHVFQARAFDANEPTAPFDTGEIAALGLLKFNGAGGVQGSVTFSVADSGADQQSCDGDIDSTASNVTVNA